MQHLGLLFTLALLAVNLWGLMLAAGAYWRNRWFALPAGPILAVTVLYGIECHVGLGRTLPGLELASTALSVLLIGFCSSRRVPGWIPARLLPALSEWRTEFAPRRVAGAAAVFAAIFLYALAWRFAFPSVDGSSEKIADLSYICSYMAGTKIPVPDVWFYPYLSTQYYSFQHYGAALMGRVLLLPPGTTYNLGFCLLIALGGSAFAGAVALAARKLWVRALLLAGFVIGGMGTTLIVHLTDTGVGPTTSMRFIGSAQMDREWEGTWLKDYQQRHAFEESPGHKVPMELPGEPYSYSIYLGDYHAPLSGYYLMGLAAMAMLLWSRQRKARYAVIVGCTLTWSLLANTWVLPLQALGTLAWLAASSRDARRLVPAVAAGAAGVWLAAWVYLSAFTVSAAGYNAALKPVPWDEHTPPLLLLIFMLPTVALIVLGLLSGERAGRWLGALWLGFLLFSEYFYVDDVYSGHFDRFNTTLKWWPWVAAGTLMTLGPWVLERTGKLWVRLVGALFCLYPCFYLYDLSRPVRDLIHGNRDAVGHLEGTYFLTKDEFPRLMLGRLEREKPGVVAERPEPEDFTDSACLPLFAGQTMWMGWYGHELLWRAYREDIRKRHDDLMRLFQGTLPAAGKWMSAQGIDYVLWYRKGDTPDLWAKVNASLAPDYVWCDILTYQDEDGRRVGFWRKPAAAGP